MIPAYGTLDHFMFRVQHPQKPVGCAESLTSGMMSYHLKLNHILTTPQLVYKKRATYLFLPRTFTLVLLAFRTP